MSTRNLEQVYGLGLNDINGNADWKNKFEECMSEIFDEIDNEPEVNQSDWHNFTHTKLSGLHPELYKMAYKIHLGFPYRTFVKLLTGEDPWNNRKSWSLTHKNYLMTIFDVMKSDSHLECWRKS